MTLANDLKEGLVISWGAIRANKLRSVLTTLGIVIGVATVTLMGSAISGIKNTFEQSFSILGSDVLYVSRFSWGPSREEWWKNRNRREIKLRDAQRLTREMTMARAISVEATSNATVEFQNRSATGVMVVGNNEQSALVRGSVVAEGRYLSTAEVDGARPVCILGAELAENLFPHQSPLGNKIRVGNRKLEVIGVMERMGQFMFANLDNQIILPITRFVADFAFNPEINISVKLLDPNLIDDAEVELRGIMRKIRRLGPEDHYDFAINRQDMLLDALNQGIASIATGGLFITGLSLFVGGIGIMNIMFASVMERTNEIGLRKALGARRRTILTQFLIEASIICLMGGLIGLGFAYSITLVMENYMPATLSPLVVGAALAVSVLTRIVSGYLPALRASRLSPVDALRQE